MAGKTIRVFDQHVAFRNRAVEGTCLIGKVLCAVMPSKMMGMSEAAFGIAFDAEQAGIRTATRAS